MNNLCQEQTIQTIQRKLEILADAAKYDVACTSSGVDRKGEKGHLGNSRAYGICHSFAADGRCISLLKILMTNHCVYDCKYCVNRVSNDVARASFTPEEICELTIGFYKRNYIEGLFLSSGVEKNPGYTMEKICQALHLLRTKYHFRGYIHVKVIPGAPDDLIALAGYLADRISINMELPTEESLKRLAPNKRFHTILDPMGKVANTIAVNRLSQGKEDRMERSVTNRYLSSNIFSDSGRLTYESEKVFSIEETSKCLPDMSRESGWKGRNFAPAGQSTQMIIGATEESDYQLLKTTQHLYQHYDLKRVFYSAYISLNEDAALPALNTPPPLLREHRLYQADWLLRFYGFQADELLSEDQPDFREEIDPKCNWALRHMEIFPIEVQSASIDLLLRVPGIGPKSAKRIIEARRYGSLSFESLKKMGVVLKRAHYFITCKGKMMYKIPIEEQFIFRQMISLNQADNWQIRYGGSYHQMSLFDDFGIQRS